jgi:WD40 repeat protein
MRQHHAVPSSDNGSATTAGTAAGHLPLEEGPDRSGQAGPTVPACSAIGPRPDAALARRRLLATGAIALVAAACARTGEGLPPSPPTPAPTSTPAARPDPAARSSTAVSLDPRAPRLPGRLLFVSDANIWLAERGQLRRLTPDRISRQPSWSRDGRKIAHVKLWTSGSDLWLMDPDGSHSEQLTENDMLDDPRQRYALRPIWWPDGTRLLYLSDERSYDTQLWQLTIATRRRQPFLPPAGDRLGGLDCPKLSPDGRTLAVASFQPGRSPPGRSQIWLYPLPSGPPRQLTSAPDGAYDPDWSPDGAWIACAVRRGVRHDVWVMRVDGSVAYQVTFAGACRAPAWSPDGSWLAYLSAQTGTFEVWAVRVPADPGAGAPAATPALPPPSAFRQITRGGLIDAASGLAWAP